jgi:hypothetical protein
MREPTTFPWLLPSERAISARVTRRTDLDHVEPVTGHDAYLIDALLPRPDFNGKLTGANHALYPLFALPSLQGLEGIDQQIAALDFVLVFGQTRTPGEFRGVFAIGFTRLEEALPIVMELHQDLLTHLGRECLICLVGLHPSLHLVVVEILPGKDVGLTDFVVTSIVEVLRLESSRIDHGKAGVSTPNDVLLDKLHDRVSPFSLLFWLFLADPVILFGRFG